MNMNIGKIILNNSNRLLVKHLNKISTQSLNHTLRQVKVVLFFVKKTAFSINLIIIIIVIKFKSLELNSKISHASNIQIRSLQTTPSNFKY
jgi:hypothetical protein